MQDILSYAQSTTISCATNLRALSDAHILEDMENVCTFSIVQETNLGAVSDADSRGWMDALLESSFEVHILHFRHFVHKCHHDCQHQMVFLSSAYFGANQK